MPRKHTELAALEVGGAASNLPTGQASDGAIRSTLMRAARRASPYGMLAKSPGLASAIGGLALRSAKSSAAKGGQQFRRAFPTAAAPPLGCGGAMGPMERQQRNEAHWKARNAESIQAAEERAREEALVRTTTGGRSVDEWRDATIDEFVARPPAAAPAVSASSAGSSASTRMTRTQRSQGSSSGAQLPPLPPGCAQARKGRALRLKSRFDGLLEPDPRNVEERV